MYFLLGFIHQMYYNWVMQYINQHINSGQNSSGFVSHLDYCDQATCSNGFIARALVKLSVMLSMVAGMLLTTVVADEYAAGTVTFVRNIAIAVSDAEEIRIVAKGSVIYSGDKLITEEESYAQIEFKDESKLTIRPNSELLIADFYFEELQPDKDVATFKLISGGFYSETGLIGKRGNPDAYRVDSSIANIGVRGTRYSVYLCEGGADNCSNQGGGAGAVELGNADGRNGLYVGVSSGAVEVRNDGGVQTLSQGEYAFASDNFSSPIFIEQSPIELGAVEPNLPINGCSIGY